MYWALLGVNGVGTKLNHLHYHHRSTRINLHHSSCLGCVCVVSIAVYICILCQFVCSFVSHLLCLFSSFKMLWTQLSNDRLHTQRSYNSIIINQGPVIGDIPRIVCTKSHLRATSLKDARSFFDPKFVSSNCCFGTQMKSDDLDVCNR